MLRLVFLFLSPVLVASGLLDWFELAQWGEFQDLRSRWDVTEQVNYQTVSTMSFAPVCDWVTGGVAKENGKCGPVCDLVKETFGLTYPYAVSGFSPSDHVNFVALVPRQVGHHVKITNEGTGGSDSQTANVLLSFRGTYAWDVVNNRRNFQIAFEAVSFCATCAVHRGFWRNFVAIKFSVASVVHKACDGTKAPEIPVTKRRLAVFGHSMGASLAILSSSYFQSIFSQRTNCLYTMGSPRIANAAMNVVMTAHVVHTIEIAYGKDPVPHYPPRLMGYRHHSDIYEVFFDLTYTARLASGDAIEDYSKHLFYKKHTGATADSHYAAAITFVNINDHMSYWVGLDTEDMFSCGGFADYFLKNTHAMHLFGV